MMDRIGARSGFTIAIVLWSLAAIAHAEATVFGPAAATVLGLLGFTYSASVAGFMVARFALGLGEAGNFPAAIKATAEWFPKRERAFATGIFNSGSNVGAILAPITVPWIALHMGWKWAFIITGAIGFLWLILWFMFYEIPAKQARLGKAEFDYIHSDKDEAPVTDEPQERVSWSRLLAFKQTWAFAIGKFLTDPIWWFYLFWLPDFLNKQYGLSGLQLSLPVAIVYTM